MDGAHEDAWSAIAAQWSELWAASAGPAHGALIAASAIRPGSRVLDVGCGSGEFLRELTRVGAVVSGIDPAIGMVELARLSAPHADVRVGADENLPWADGSFDVVTAINALQFADDTVAALAEFTRVCAPGGFVAVANWAEAALNDLDVVEFAIAEAAGGGREPGGGDGDGDGDDGDGDDELDGGDLRAAGGLEAVLGEAGLTVVSAGLIEVPWHVADDASLVRGVLLGEDPAVVSELAPTVLAAARPFRVDHGYRLVNTYRFAVARTP